MVEPVRVWCDACGQHTIVNKDGRLRVHRIIRGNFRLSGSHNWRDVCPGSGDNVSSTPCTAARLVEVRQQMAIRRADLTLLLWWTRRKAEQSKHSTTLSDAGEADRD